MAFKLDVFVLEPCKEIEKNVFEAHPVVLAEGIGAKVHIDDKPLDVYVSDKPINSIITADDTFHMWSLRDLPGEFYLEPNEKLYAVSLYEDTPVRVKVMHYVD